MPPSEHARTILFIIVMAFIVNKIQSPFILTFMLGLVLYSLFMRTVLPAIVLR